MFRRFVCSHPLYAQSLCLFRACVCSDPLCVQAHCMFTPFLCSDPLYVQTLCIFRPSVCSDPLYVQTLCKLKPFVCSDPLYVQILCAFKPVFPKKCFLLCWNKLRKNDFNKHALPGAMMRQVWERGRILKLIISSLHIPFLFLFGPRAFTINFALFSAACSCCLVMCVSAVPNIHCHGVVDMLPDTHLWIAFLGGCGCHRLGRLLAGGLALHCLACVCASTLAAQPVVEYAFLSQPAPTQL